MRILTIFLFWLNILAVISLLFTGLYFQLFINAGFAVVLYFQLKTMDHLKRKTKNGN